MIAALVAVGGGNAAVALPAMRPQFRDDLRRQLVAIAPRLIEESLPATTPSTGTVSATHGVHAAASHAGRPRRFRAATTVVAATAVVLAGAGAATALSRNAVPGDLLYGLKRAAESVDVAFATDDVQAGHAHLVDAQRRVNEASTLLARPQAMALGAGSSAAGGMSDRTAQLVVDTLRSADESTRDGVRTIADDAVAHGDREGLALVVAWAPGQRDRIDALVSRLDTDAAGDGSPAPAATQARTAAAQIRAAYARAEALLSQLGQACGSRGHDALGPLPCSAASSSPTSNPTGATSMSPTGATTATSSGPAATAPGTSPTAAPSGTRVPGAPTGGSNGSSRTPGAGGASTASTPGALPTAVPPASALPTSVLPTSIVPTSVLPTSIVPTSVLPTSVLPTSVLPTSVLPPSVLPTSIVPTSVLPTSVLPTSVLPTTPSLPVGAGSCGVQVGGVSIGSCPAP